MKVDVVYDYKTLSLCLTLATTIKEDRLRVVALPDDRGHGMTSSVTGQSQVVTFSDHNVGLVVLVDNVRRHYGEGEK